MKLVRAAFLHASFCECDWLSATIESFPLPFLIALVERRESDDGGFAPPNAGDGQHVIARGIETNYMQNGLRMRIASFSLSLFDPPLIPLPVLLLFFFFGECRLARVPLVPFFSLPRMPSLRKVLTDARGGAEGITISLSFRTFI